MYQLDTANINVLDDITAETTARICPFSNHGPNEDDIGNKYYGAANQHDSRIGYYSGLYVGHAEEEEFRARGSSGGMLTWILTELIRTGKVDAVVHVKKADNPHDGILFRYAVSKTPDEVQAGAKSRYYPVEAS